MDKEELIRIFKGMSDSEKAGLLFGLFPERLNYLSNEDCIFLIRLYKGE